MPHAHLGEIAEPAMVVVRPKDGSTRVRRADRATRFVILLLGTTGAPVEHPGALVNIARRRTKGAPVSAA